MQRGRRRYSIRTCCFLSQEVPKNPTLSLKLATKIYSVWTKMYTLPLFAYIFIFLHIFDIVFSCLVISFLSEIFLAPSYSTGGRSFVFIPAKSLMSEQKQHQ